MRDYENMPVLSWQGDLSARKAKAQIAHEEPVILQMDTGFEVALDGAAWGCHLDESAGRFLGCHPREALTELAKAIGEPSLAMVGEAAAQAGQVADLEPKRGRIIIHD